MTQRQRDYAALLAGTIAPLALVPVVLWACSVFHGCSSTTPGLVTPEPAARVAALPSGNAVTFGASIASPDSQAQALAAIDASVRGRLPGWTFEVYRFPVSPAAGQVGVGPGGAVYGESAQAVSFRDFQAKRIVLSWWPRDTVKPWAPDQVLSSNLGTWGVGDAAWEVEHAVSWTDDSGNPWLDTPKETK